MSERTANLVERLGVTAEQIKVTAMVDAGIIMANLLDRSDMTVYADDSLARQAERAFPSAWAAPETGSEGAVAVAADIGLTSVSLLAAQKTSSNKELAATAVSAQAAGCATNAVAERSGWLTQAERTQEDVGFSSIGIAWFTKYLLDRASQSREKPRRWYAALGVFASSVTVALPVAEGSQGGKLDFASHAAGLCVGWLAYKVGRWRNAPRKY